MAQLSDDQRAVNVLAWSTLGLAGVCAAGDVLSILLSNRTLEYVTKPAVMVLLIVLALLIRPANDSERAFFVLALVLGLAGDVLLVLPSDLLIPGLAAFLIGHLAYIAGFRFGGFAFAGAIAGVVIVAVSAVLLVPRVVAALESSSKGRLKRPVLAYVAVISLMTVSATASGSLVAAAGGLLFFFSDALFAWYRFVDPVRWGRPLNIVMYQAGQALLVLSLAR